MSKVIRNASRLGKKAVRFQLYVKIFRVDLPKGPRDESMVTALDIQDTTCVRVELMRGKRVDSTKAHDVGDAMWDDAALMIPVTLFRNSKGGYQRKPFELKLFEAMAPPDATSNTASEHHDEQEKQERQGPEKKKKDDALLATFALNASDFARAGHGKASTMKLNALPHASKTVVKEAKLTVTVGCYFVRDVTSEDDLSTVVPQGNEDAEGNELEDEQDLSGFENVDGMGEDWDAGPGGGAAQHPHHGDTEKDRLSAVEERPLGDSVASSVSSFRHGSDADKLAPRGQRGKPGSFSSGGGGGGGGGDFEFSREDESTTFEQLLGQVDELIASGKQFSDDNDANGDNDDSTGAPPTGRTFSTSNRTHSLEGALLMEEDVNKSLAVQGERVMEELKTDLSKVMRHASLTPAMMAVAQQQRNAEEEWQQQHDTGGPEAIPEGSESETGGGSSLVGRRSTLPPNLGSDTASEKTRKKDEEIAALLARVQELESQLDMAQRESASVSPYDLSDIHVNLNASVSDGADLEISALRVRVGTPYTGRFRNHQHPVYDVVFEGTRQQTAESIITDAHHTAAAAATSSHNGSTGEGSGTVEATSSPGATGTSTRPNTNRVVLHSYHTAVAPVEVVRSFRFRPMKDFRNKVVEEIEVKTPFPDSYVKNKFGIQLSPEEVQQRADDLGVWLQEVFRRRSEFSPRLRQSFLMLFQLSEPSIFPSQHKSAKLLQARKEANA